MRKQSQIQHIFTLMQRGRFDEALRPLERICTKTPNDFESHYLRAVCLGYTGHLVEAIEAFKTSLHINPHQAMCWCGLGMAQKAVGHFDHAIDSFRKALEIKQDYLDARLGLAQALVQQQRYAESQKQLDIALQSNPENPDVLCSYGDYYLAINHFKQALDMYKNALKFRPHDVALHYKCGTCNLRLGLLNDAAFHLKECIKHDPKNELAILDLAKTLSLAGDHSGAYDCYERILKLNPHHILARIGKAHWFVRNRNYDLAWDIIKQLLNDSVKNAELATLFLRIAENIGKSNMALQYAKDVINSNNINKFDKCSLHFMLGKFLDKMNRYDEAFKEFRMGNELANYNYDAEAHRLYIESIITQYNEKLFYNAPKLTDSKPIPIFIVGMPRSGTSLVEQILDSHPMVDGLGERLDLAQIENKLNKYKEITNDRHHIVGKADFLEEIKKDYLEKIRNVTNAAYYVDKLPHNFLRLGIIAILFPNAKIIHCIRNPIDTCLSIYFQNFNASHAYSTNLENIGRHYKDYKKIMSHWEKVLPIPIFKVQYESLIKNPFNIIKELLDFCGLDWNDNCLNFYNNKRIVTTSSEDQVIQPIYTTSIERWKNYSNHLDDLLNIIDIYR